MTKETIESRGVWAKMGALASSVIVTMFSISISFLLAVDANASSEESAVSATLDNSFATAYMFRGTMNERDGLIWQPSVELAVNLYSADEGAVRSVDAGFGVWLSVHSMDTGSSGTGPDALSETDYYPSLAVEWGGNLTSSISYYWYTSPNGGWRTVEEVIVEVSYDDSDALGAFALHPTAAFAFETKRSSIGSGKGSVLVLGVEPAIDVNIISGYPVSFTFPVALGVSMDAYYRMERETEESCDCSTYRDRGVGYATIGAHASLPLAFVPTRYGEWVLTNGLDLYLLSDPLADMNQHDGVYPVWTSSLTLDF